MALLLAQGQPATVVLGPFVDETDGDTILHTLTITAAQTQLSVNAAVFAPKHDPSTATYDQGGYYRITLDATDTASLGQGRVVVKMPGALAVWQDVFIVSPTTYAQLAGLSIMPMCLRGTATSIILGPCIAANDAVTLVSNLTLVASQVLLSKADGVLAPLHSPTPIVPLGMGMYRIPLDVADTNTPGALQVIVDPGTCLPVWMDLSVVQSSTWALFFPLPVVPPPAPLPAPITGPLTRRQGPRRLPLRRSRIGSHHFDVAKQAAQITGHGTAVWIVPRVQCPCLVEEGQPDPRCSSCQGIGRYYPEGTGYASTMLLVHETAEHSLQETGFWTSGMVQATVLPGLSLAWEDYVRQVDVKATFANEVLTKDLDDTLLFRHGVALECVVDRERVYRPGRDYVLTPPNTITWIAGGQAPPFQSQYAVRYKAYAEYLVAPETPRLRIEHRRAQSRVVTLKLLEKTSKVA